MNRDAHLFRAEEALRTKEYEARIDQLVLSFRITRAEAKAAVDEALEWIAAHPGAERADVVEALSTDFGLSRSKAEQTLAEAEGWLHRDR